MMQPLSEGQSISVHIRDTDEEGKTVWMHWFDGVYLTTENVGNGPEMRIKNQNSGNHIRIKELADDLKIEVEENG